MMWWWRRRLVVAEGDDGGEAGVDARPVGRGIIGEAGGLEIGVVVAWRFEWGMLTVLT